MIDSNTYHVQGTIRKHPSMGLAYIDDGRSLEGRTHDDPVGVIMAHDQIDGEPAGSASLRYDTLARAIRATANDQGVARAADITKFLATDAEVGRSRSFQEVGGVRKEGRLSHISTVPACPPGLVHPVVDYAFRLMPDCIQVDYTAARGVEILNDERRAILDNDGNGKAEPAHDSILAYVARSRESGTEFVGNLVPFDRLQQALTDLGGHADEPALRSRFTELTMQPGQNFEVSAFTPLPDPLQSADREVEKTFHQTPAGGIFVEYHMTDRRSFTGGWSS